MERVGSFMRNCWQGFGHKYVDDSEYDLVQRMRNPELPKVKVPKTDEEMGDPAVKTCAS